MKRKLFNLTAKFSSKLIPILLSIPVFFTEIGSIYSQENILFPVGSDFVIHAGEDFCDEMYFHSYRSRKFHTAEDYILKWEKPPLEKSNYTETELIKLHEQNFGYLPVQAEFWKDKDARIHFLKINLYRVNVDIIDTKIGLYPRSSNDSVYGYGKQAYAVYSGKVIKSVSPEKPKGWGKAILIEHKAPKDHVFVYKTKNRVFKIKRFWSQYSHNLKNLVSFGEIVKPGQPVVLIGDGNGIFNTQNGVNGILEGAHLHFEIRVKEYKIFPDPDLLEDRNKLEEIYVKPSDFLSSVKIVRSKGNLVK